MMNLPPCRFANSQLKIAVRAPPTCRCPVGDGANRTRTVIGRAVYRVECGGHAAALSTAAMPRVHDGMAVVGNISGGVAAALRITTLPRWASRRHRW